MRASQSLPRPAVRFLRRQDEEVDSENETDDEENGEDTEEEQEEGSEPKESAEQALPDVGTRDDYGGPTASIESLFTNFVPSESSIGLVEEQPERSQPPPPALPSASPQPVSLQPIPPLSEGGAVAENPPLSPESYLSPTDLETPITPQPTGQVPFIATAPISSFILDLPSSIGPLPSVSTPTVVVTKTRIVPDFGNPSTSWSLARDSDRPDGVVAASQNSEDMPAVSPLAQKLLISMGVLSGVSLLIIAIAIVLKRRKLARDALYSVENLDGMQKDGQHPSRRVLRVEKTVTITQVQQRREPGRSRADNANPKPPSTYKAPRTQ